MDYIAEGIKNVREKKLDVMKESFKKALNERAAKKLQEAKAAVAQSFFAKANS